MERQNMSEYEKILIEQTKALSREVERLQADNIRLRELVHFQTKRREPTQEEMRPKYGCI